MIQPMLLLHHKLPLLEVEEEVVVIDFFSSLTNDQIGMLSTQELVDRDNQMYGNTFPLGSFTPTDTNSMVNRDKMLYGNTFPEGSFNITKPKGGQGGLPLGTTTLRDGEKQEDNSQR